MEKIKPGTSSSLHQAHQQAPPPSSAAAACCKKQPLTTFVQTDSNTFREVVQRLTGPTTDHNHNHHHHHQTSSLTTTSHAPPAIKGFNFKRTATVTATAAATTNSTSKLHERRQWTRPKLHIVKPTAAAAATTMANFQFFKPTTAATSASGGGGGGGGGGNSASYSSKLGSPVGTPSKVFSKLSILESTENKKNEELMIMINGLLEEEKAIKERRFYLHPSPRSSSLQAAGYNEPELLTLFPLESPKTTTHKHI